jgi:hypothetical protein
MAVHVTKCILVMLLLAGCRDADERGEAPGAAAPLIRSRLEAAVASGATSFDFAAADPAFDWDRMHIFGPYRTKAEVAKELGFSWSGFDRTTIETSDSVVLVVFVRDGKVVHWYEHPRDAGDLAPLGGRRGYTRTEATFRIERRKETRGEWVELKPLETRSSTTAPVEGLQP